MSKFDWILISIGIGSPLFSVWWLRRKLGIDVVEVWREGLRSELSQPVPIRTPLLVVFTLLPLGMTVFVIATFTFSAGSVIGLAIYMAISLVLVRAILRRVRRRSRA